MRNANEQHVYGYLREIRAAAQGLQGLLADANAKGADKSAAERAAFYAAALSEADQLRAQTTGRVDGSLTAIRKVFDTDAEMHDWCSDYIVRIEDAWKRVAVAWPAAGRTPDEVADAFRSVVPRLDEIIFQCALLTISQRINDVLDNMRIGQPFRFQDAFAEELPLSKDLRARLFGELVAQEGVLQKAYISGDSGYIYRVGATRAAQRWSVVRIVAAPVVGIGVVDALCHAGAWCSLEGWPLDPARTAATIANYVFVYVGAAFHLVIAGVTASRARTEPTRTPWNDWVLWLHAHEVSVLYSMLYVFLGFAFLTITMKDLSWQTAFFAGYSIDSVIEVFLDRLGRMSKAEWSKLSKGLGAADPKQAAVAGASP